MPQKPKNNSKSAPLRDCFQTPPYAVDILIPYIRNYRFVWESAAGEGMLANTLRAYEFNVIREDILTGQDYFTNSLSPKLYDIQVTNPPFSIKYKWLARAYELGMPFALLMPSDTMFSQTAQNLFKKHGFTMLVPNRRVDYKTPIMGWVNPETGKPITSQFSSSWFLGHIPDPQGVVFVDMPKPPLEETIARVEREKTR